MKILLISGDRQAGEQLADLLTDHRYVVERADERQVGIDLASRYAYDLILVDSCLPQLDAISVSREVRSSSCLTPILILTTDASNTHLIAALDAGADDSMVKPCDACQLLARIRALLRRSGVAASASNLTWGDLCLDPTSAQIRHKGQVITLTPSEYRLLELFLRYPQRVFSRSAIIDHLWSLDDSPSENAVTNLIKDLRRKLKAAEVTPNPIETVYGLGYRLKALPGEADKPPTTPHSQPRPASPQADLSLLEASPTLAVAQAAKPTASRFSQLIQRFRASLERRLAFLEEAMAELRLGRLTVARRQQLQAEAHKLAGGLGTFGYVRGSALAREIEHLLMAGPASSHQASRRQSQRLDQLLAELRWELNQPPRISEMAVEPAAIAQKRVLVLDDDRFFTDLLAQEAPVWGLEVEVTPEWSTLLHRLTDTSPVAVLLNLDSQNLSRGGLWHLQQLQEQFPMVPILALAEHNNLADRVQVACAGGRAYLPKPIAAQQVFQAMAQFLLAWRDDAAKVLLVDDDPWMLANLTTLLQPCGLAVTSLDNPNQFWDVLTTTEPDLLILDLEMPTFNGIDLCRVVRQDLHWADLPLLVVTAHADVDSIQRAFAAGADDFIRKPVIGPELVSRVTSRLERRRSRSRPAGQGLITSPKPAVAVSSFWPAAASL
jgi:DNA-binding response OmpR family regulator